MEKSGVLKQLKGFWKRYKKDIEIQCRMTSVLLLIWIAYSLGNLERQSTLDTCVSLVNSGCRVEGDAINCSGVRGIPPGLNLSIGIERPDDVVSIINSSG